jgi:hypothetical protein
MDPNHALDANTPMHLDEGSFSKNSLPIFIHETSSPVAKGTKGSPLDCYIGDFSVRPRYTIVQENFHASHLATHRYKLLQ